MKDVRGWIEAKLGANGFSSVRVHPRQLDIARDGHSNARILCIGLEQGENVDARDIDALLEEVPDTGFIVVVPTRIAHAAYERAEERGICISGFGELLAALREDDDISKHVDSQESYERRRLLYNRHVTSLKRKGHHIYEIHRSGLRPLTISTSNNYEFTADELYTVIEGCEGIDIDLIVVTNPNCRGFSTDSQNAAKQVGIPLVRLVDFLDDLGNKWT